MKKKNSVKLVKFTKKFITQDYIGWLNNKTLMKYSENRHTSHDIKSCKKYLESFKNKSNKFFAIIDSKNFEYVGSITAMIDNKNKTADIGILIGKGNNGYGFLAWKYMMNYLFKRKIRKITGGCMANNKAMINIFIKSKMKFEYKKKKQFLYSKNKSVDLVVYYKFNKINSLV